MKRSIIVLFVCAVALAMSAVPVSAGPVTAASGTWDYEIVGELEVRVVGPDVYFFGNDVGEWHGTLEGFTEEEFVVVCHSAEGFNVYNGQMTFTGTVFDSSGVPHEGTMTMMGKGIQYSDTCDPSPALWSGNWVITGGTGDLEGVRGRGTAEGPSFHQTYEGRINLG